MFFQFQFKWFLFSNFKIHQVFIMNKRHSRCSIFDDDNNINLFSVLIFTKVNEVELEFLLKDINSNGTGNFYRLHVNSATNDTPVLYFNNNEVLYINFIKKVLDLVRVDPTTRIPKEKLLTFHYKYTTILTFATLCPRIY